jgi:WD40 repeat protein/serine/threonine protein kinase
MKQSEETKKLKEQEGRGDSYSPSQVDYISAPVTAHSTESVIQPPIESSTTQEAQGGSYSVKVDYTASPIASEQPSMVSLQTDKIDPNLDPFTGVYYLPPNVVTFYKDKPLGSGAFGQVWQGQWGNRLVALKEIDIPAAQQKLGISKGEVLEALEWEMARLSAVDHPNLVQFYGAYQFQGKTYLVIEFCEGGNLQKVLNQQFATLNWATRWQWALEITQGLAYLHHQGALHRDLKAENVLLDQHNRARLADLGVAQVDALLQQSEAKVVEKGFQDQRFIAPEVLKKPGSDTTASDIYALGLVFWQLVSGQEPRFRNRQELLQWMQSGEREPIPSDCPDEFRELILSCWQFEPEKRPSAKAVVEKISKIGANFHPKADWLKLCEVLDEQIHSSRAETLKYVAPYVTARRVDEDLDTYWKRLEGHIEQEGTFNTSNPPLELNETFNDFLNNPQTSILLLLGESGLGKTLSTYQLAGNLLAQWWGCLESNQRYTPYTPIFIRPMLNNWSYSELTDGIDKVFERHQLDMSLPEFKNAPWLFIIDGYDECQADVEPQNLPQQLGLHNYPNAKLLVTSRPHIVNELELSNRFASNNNLVVRYFLPFSIHQLLNYLKINLYWNDKNYSDYQEKLQQSRQLRTVLRNPFVLSLLVQSWETVKEKDFSQLTRWQIYQGFVEHWLNQKKNLLSDKAQVILSQKHPSLLESFNAFASEMAFFAFQKKLISLPKYQEVELVNSSSYWLNLEKLVSQCSQETFSERQRLLTIENRRRALLSEKDYAGIMLWRLKQFEAGSPLKNRMLDCEFIHKSFFEYFTAKRVVELRKYQAEDIVRAGLQLLNYRSLQEEPETLNFMVEAWRESDTKRLKDPFFQIIDCSKKEATVAQAAANAITVLNRVNALFWKKDFSNIRIPNADLRNSICNNSNFTNADLSRVQFQAASLVNTNFKNAKMQGVNFGELSYLPIKDISYSCCYSRDGRLLAVAIDKMIQIYNIHTRSLLHSLEGHTFSVYSVSFSPNGAQLASGSGDKTIRLWNVETGELQKTLEGHGDYVRSVSFSPDGQLLASGSHDQTLRLWNVETGELQKTLEGHSDFVRSVSFSPNGNLLASGSNDKSIRLWNVDRGELLKTLEGHSSDVYSVSFSPDGELLASGSNDKSIRLWNVDRGELLKTLEGHSSDVYSVSFSPDGELLASGSNDKSIRLWNVDRGELLKTLEGHSSDVYSVSFSQNGEQLASGGGGDYRNNVIRLWNVDRGELLKTLEGHTSQVNSVSFSPNGDLLASGGNTILLWNVERGELLKTLNHSGVRSVAFSPNGQLLASGGGNTILLWNIERGELLKTLEGHTSSVMSVSFSPNGQLLASGSWDNTIRLWNVETGELLKALDGHTASVMSVSFSPNGQLLASGSHDLTIRLWNVERGELLKTLFQKTIKGIRGDVNSVSFSPNGEQLASGSRGGNICLWNVETGELQKILYGHTYHVSSVSFSPNGEQLASGSFDQTILLWNVEGGELYKKRVASGVKSQLFNLNTFSNIHSLAWKQNLTNGETYLATGHSDASVRYWRVTQVQNTPFFELLWSTTRKAKLDAQDANIKDAQGLSLPNAQLLAQRGAKGEPNMLQALISAAEQGDVNAQTELGKLYLEGKKTLRDLNKAMQLFAQAAEKDHPLAAFYLGKCYEAGKGVSKNKQIAHEWYMMAAKLGSKEAQKKLNTFSQKFQSLIDTGHWRGAKSAKSLNKDTSEKLKTLASETILSVQERTQRESVGNKLETIVKQTKQLSPAEEVGISTLVPQDYQVARNLHEQAVPKDHVGSKQRLEEKLPKAQIIYNPTNPDYNPSASNIDYQSVSRHLFFSGSDMATSQLTETRSTGIALPLSSGNETSAENPDSPGSDTIHYDPSPQKPSSP